MWKFNIFIFKGINPKPFCPILQLSCNTTSFPIIEFLIITFEPITQFFPIITFCSIIELDPIFVFLPIFTFLPIKTLFPNLTDLYLLLFLNLK